METPIGKVYSTNITPDKKAGIGDWSFADFDKLMRTGVTKHGYTVYPAMPYPSYSRLSEADMQALYAYFMHGVKAEPTPNKAADIPGPVDAFPLTIWRWAFAPRRSRTRCRRRAMRNCCAAPTWCRAWATAAPATRRAAWACRKNR
jgi:hypothetical protein